MGTSVGPSYAARPTLSLPGAGIGTPDAIVLPACVLRTWEEADASGHRAHTPTIPAWPPACATASPTVTLADGAGVHRPGPRRSTRPRFFTIEVEGSAAGGIGFTRART